MLKNQKGFTLIEMLLSLSLLLIALGLGYQLLFYAQDSFERSGHYWQRQNEVIALSSYISDVIDKSLYINITSDDSVIVASDGAIFKEEAGVDIYLQNGLIETVKIGSDLDVSFNKVLDINSNYYSDLLELTVRANDVDYELATKIKIENMVEDRRIVGDTTGTIIVFRTKETIEEVPISIESCYIATAANGSKMEPSVMLLRRFRDQVLLESSAGREFVKLYYKYSPPLANAIASNNTFKLITRIILLPIVGLATLMLEPILIVYILVGTLLAYITFKKRKRVNLI